jgi:Uma2 family endonuclease
MTAASTGEVMWTPDPVMQRYASFTVEHVLALPPDAPRVELRDGVMIVVPSPTGRHQKINIRLASWLMQHAPDAYETLAAVGVALSFKDTLEPDVVLLKRPVRLDQHLYDVEQVVLAVEIVSPGTKRRDRLEKPAEYAAAGVRHYWRIEQDPVHVFAYDLVDGAYRLVADSNVELVLTEPFTITLPIRDIAP